MKGDLFGSFCQLVRFNLVEEGNDGFMEIFHGHMPQLYGPTNGIRRVGLGDGHLIMGVIDPAFTVI